MSRSRDTDRSLPADAAGKPAEPDSTGGQLAPVVGMIAGDARARSGEDTRRRGWFWHWNAIVTQYAPLIGLKGVGLLNSYTVWTDRREESPHRGYAFPSQQSEADFYGEDRAELITINKILVALDLIEIRKEMVLRVDEAGRRWKVPHNLYRVKDRDDGFSLTASAVERVVQLAGKDKAVYRYIRHIFSPKFRPIDANNVWTGILETARSSPTWVQLAEKAALEDARASARTRAGHQSRKSPGKSKAGDSQSATPVGNDSTTVNSRGGVQTIVAMTNTGSRADVAPANNGLDGDPASGVAQSNEAGASDVAPANTTYHQSNTTTTTENERPPEIEIQSADSVALQEVEQVSFGPGGSEAPADRAGQEAALRAFHDANHREATLAERKLLRDLAERFEMTARDSGAPGRQSGWQWVTAAIFDAVDAGSTYVAPRRVREILIRWERDGFPGEHNTKAAKPSKRGTREPKQRPVRPSSAVVVHSDEGEAGSANVEPLVAAQAPLPVEPFPVPEIGLSSAQLWQAVLDDLQRAGTVGRANVEAWLRPSTLAGRSDRGVFIIGVPNRLVQKRVADRFAPAIADCLAGLLGIPCAVEVVVAQEWLQARIDQADGQAGEKEAS